jgi:uncharacterized membrane protein YfcA
MGSVTVLVLVLIGVLTGLTTVLFGFGGGFVTVPVIVWADAALGSAAGTVAVATSAIVMVVNAAVATTATPRVVLARLRGRGALLGLLAAGGLVGALAAMAVPAEVPSWGFLIYVAVTIIDVLVRPGFLRPVGLTHDDTSQRRIPTACGAPIGAVASFLGVGGSVMTVPLLRRGGLPMGHAAALANPLTLAISIPAAARVPPRTPHDDGTDGAVFGVGIVDLGAAALLLAGAIPIIVLAAPPPTPHPRPGSCVGLRRPPRRRAPGNGRFAAARRLKHRLRGAGEHREQPDTSRGGRIEFSPMNGPLTVVEKIRVPGGTRRRACKPRAPRGRSIRNRNRSRHVTQSVTP